MMEKLPHEKLLEWAEESKKGNFYPSTLMAEEFDLPIASEAGERDAFHKLADEIADTYIPRSEHEEEIKRIVEAQGWNGYSHGDSHHIMKTYAEKSGMPMEDGESITKWLSRWFIKRPCFEDGEPMRFGDEVEWADHTTRNITGFGVTAAGSPYVTCAYDGNGANDAMIFGAILHRPAPKVYDADGVEIKVGDTLYWTEETARCGKKYVVNGIGFEKGFSSPIQVWDVTGEWMPPHELTHREPDSFSKLRDDMLRNSIDPIADEIAEWIDRLTALIERGV